MADETKADEKETTTAKETTTTTATTTTQAAEPAKVHLSPEEYRELLESRAKLAESEARAKREAEEKEANRLKALAEKGEGEKALQSLRETKDAEIKAVRDRADSLEAERLSDRKEAAISSALVGASFASDAAARDARLVLEGRFEAVRGTDGRVQVIDRATRRPAADAIKDWLASDDSAHYRKASTTGGAGSRGTDRDRGADGARPATIMDALAAHDRSRANPEVRAGIGFGPRSSHN